MIKGVEGRVRRVLEKYPQTKDDDMQLFAMIIVDFFNYNSNYIDSLSAGDLIKKIGGGSIPHFTSVLRCRQKLQEMCADLRGKNYAIRKKHADTVKEELRSYHPDTGQKDLFRKF